MSAYPSSLSPVPALNDEMTLQAAVQCLTQNLPIEMEGGYSPQELFETLF
ncbi:hypothetical protein TUMEXPCC7403_12755 [Tumidithrix helvetica PCC 7403]